MADATDGKAHILAHVKSSAGAIQPLVLGASGGIQTEPVSATQAQYVQQKQPPTTYLLSSTGVVSVGVAVQPATINRLFQVIKTGTGDLQHLLQGTLDPRATSSPADAIWATLMTSTGNELSATTAPYRYVRSNVLSVSGTLTVEVRMAG